MPLLFEEDTNSVKFCFRDLACPEIRVNPERRQQGGCNDSSYRFLDVCHHAQVHFRDQVAMRLGLDHLHDGCTVARNSGHSTWLKGNSLLMMYHEVQIDWNLDSDMTASRACVSYSSRAFFSYLLMLVGCCVSFSMP